MSASINQTSRTNAVSGGTGLPADWMSKLAAGSASSDLAVDKIDFSRMLERHATGGGASSGQGAMQSSGLSPEARNAMARAQANAQAAARQHNNVMAPASTAQNKPATPSPQAGNVQRSEARPATQPKPQQAAGKNGDASREHADAGADEQDAAKTAQTATASTEGAAVVRELKAPDNVSANDPNAMLAWLSSLTQGDLAQSAQADLQGSASADRLGTHGGQDGGQLAAGAEWFMQSMLGAAGAASGIDISGMAEAGGKLAVEMLDKAGGDFGGALAAEMLRGQNLAGGVKASATFVSDAVPTPVNSPDFSQALADKVSMLVQSTDQDGPLTAELHLNPAEMGPISVKISLDGQSAQIDFAAAAVETRKAIEASLSMLSASLDEVGLTLGGAGVSDQTAQQSFGQSDGQSAAPWAASANSGADATSSREDVSMVQTRVPSRGGLAGGLDLYA